jgi:hypothetical protein
VRGGRGPCTGVVIVLVSCFVVEDLKNSQPNLRREYFSSRGDDLGA